jgi:hypothetical protein
MISRMPATRSLHLIDRVLSFLLLAMGLIMVYLTLTSGSVMLALASPIFLTVGFVKIRDLIPAAFRTIRKPVRPGGWFTNIFSSRSHRPRPPKAWSRWHLMCLSPGGAAPDIERH